MLASDRQFSARRYRDDTEQPGKPRHALARYPGGHQPRAPVRRVCAIFSLRHRLNQTLLLTFGSIAVLVGIFVFLVP